MIDLQTYVIFLLAIALVGIYYIIRVILKQVKLFRIQEEPVIESFRVKLFALSMVILLMGLIPIGINFITLCFETGRPDRVGALSFVYSSNVHLQSLLLSYILWRIYRISGEEDLSKLEEDRKKRRRK